MFRTLFINLLFYPHLLSMSFVMSVANTYHSHVMILALRELDHLFLSYLVILIHVQSIYVSSYSSRHTPTAFIINLKLLWCDCFLPLVMSDLLLFLKSLSSESRDEILFRGEGCDSSCT
jgi:hypothetical protein